MSRSDTPSADTGRSPRRRYRLLLGIIRANGGDPQHPLVAASHLWVVCGHADISKTDAVRSLQAARENGDVFRWRDPEGRWRYGLTDAGYDKRPSDLSLYGPGDRQALQNIVLVEAEREDPDRDVIGWANRHLSRIDSQEDGDE